MTTPTPPTPTEPAEIRHDIAQTRERLSHTVEALAHKMNVPERVKDTVRETTATVQDKADQIAATLPDPWARRAQHLLATIRQRPLPTAAIALGTFLILRRLLRRRNH